MVLIPVYSFGNCEVVSYIVYEEMYANVPFRGGYTLIDKKQCLDITIRSLSSVGHQVKDVEIKATYENETSEASQLKPKKLGDSDTSFIYKDYNGKACFKGSSKIISVECSFK